MKHWKKLTKAYKQKLTLTNGEILPDPYALTNWVDDIPVFPEITYPDIYTYLVDSPNRFTKEAMKAYKSLRAYKSLKTYNFYQSRHVQDIFYNDFLGIKPNKQRKPEFCAIKTKVIVICISMVN